jgi:hypothetical protein
MTQPAASKAVTRERRQHDRVELAGYGTFTLADSGRVLRIQNVGYSGMLLVPVSGEPLRESLVGCEIAGTLRVFDLVSTAKGHAVRLGPDGLGVSFDHSEAGLLEELRRLLDPARYGVTMVAMNKAYVAEAYKGPEWRVFQGLGPTVLTMRVGPGGSLEEFALTIRPGGYQVVELQEGALAVGAMKEGVAGYKSAPFDPRLPEHRLALRRAVGVLLGMGNVKLGEDVKAVLAHLAAAVGSVT